MLLAPSLPAASTSRHPLPPPPGGFSISGAGCIATVLIGVILPAEFVGSATMNASMSGAAQANGFVSGTVVNADTATGGVYVSRISTATSQSIIIEFDAIGRWF